MVKIVVAASPSHAVPVALTHVESASLPDRLPWHEQADSTVDRPAVLCDLVIGELGSDLVNEEVRRPGWRHELISVLDSESSSFSSSRRNIRHLRLDLLGLVLRPGESQQPVVGVTDITKTP